MNFPEPPTIVALLLVGLLVGTTSGMVGIGGGVLVIPALMIFFGFSQAKANGTSLAMLLPPIGIFAALSYWKAGNIDLAYATLLAVGFAAGAWLGAKIVNAELINPTALRVLFATLLLYIAGRMLFRSGGRARAALETVFVMGAFLVSYFAMRLLGHQLRQSPKWGATYKNRRHEPAEQDYEI